MSREYEMNAYTKKSTKVTSPVSDRELIGGLTSSGHGNLVADNVVIVHPDASALAEAVDDSCPQHKTDAVDYKVLYVVVAAAVAYLLIYS